MRRWLLLLLLTPAGPVCAQAPETPVAPPPVAPAPPALVEIGPALREVALPLSAGVAEDLRLRRWDAAADSLRRIDPTSLPAAQRPRHAFVTAWALTRADRADEAAPLLGLLDDPDLPVDDVGLLRAEILRATGALTEALAAAEAVPERSPRWGRAQVVRAEILRELGRTREGFEVYEALVARPDPALGNPEALLALAQRAGAGNPEGYPHLRRLWAAYPRSESAAAGDALLGQLTGPAWRPTWQEVGLRAEAVMAGGDLAEAGRLTAARAGEVVGNELDACRFAYVHGRALYRQNELTNAIAAFGDRGNDCVGEGAAYGAKILYLKGTAQFRKRQYRLAADTFLRIASRYPTDRLADDGLLHAGIALQEAGDLAAARATWLRGLEELPEGDMVPEASFRVAFSYYLDGQPEQARDVAAALGALPVASDPVHVAAGRYWHARWLLYPDVDAPTRAVAEPEARRRALDEWAALCRDLPHSFYAIQAHARLVDLDPAAAAAVATRPAGHDAGDLSVPWRVRQELLDDDHLRAGVALARVGLVRDALDDWAEIGIEELLPDEKAWLTELRIAAGDWLLAHDDLRGWMKTHPPSTLGPAEPQVLRVAYPDRYWTEVQTAAAGYRYPPRLFHALVREESNFNAKIRSHAGAIGLSQLMPATAQQTAGWLGMRVTTAQLDDPATNLRIGARYLDALHGQLDGSPYLMLAGYNAGAGRVGQWLTAWGNVPTDEYVERIPFKETREYVKRVMGTWQVYRYQFDTQEPPFPDLSAYVHAARPE